MDCDPAVAVLYGVENEREIPLYVNANILATLRERYRRNRLMDLVPIANDGYWQHLIGAALERDIYAFTVKTMPESCCLSKSTLSQKHQKRIAFPSCPSKRIGIC